MDIVMVFVVLAVLCLIAIAFIVFVCVKISRDMSHIARDAKSLMRATQEAVDARHAQPEAGKDQPASYLTLVLNVVHRFYITFERKKARIRRSHALWQERKDAHFERVVKIFNRK